MSGIEEAYAKYAKNLLENKLNQALDRLDEQGAIIANLTQVIGDLQVKSEFYSRQLEVFQKRMELAFERVNLIKKMTDSLDSQVNGDDEEWKEQKEANREVMLHHIREIEIRLGFVKHYFKD